MVEGGLQGLSLGFKGLGFASFGTWIWAHGAMGLFRYRAEGTWASGSGFRVSGCAT